MGHSAGRKIENLFFIFLPPALLLLRGYLPILEIQKVVLEVEILFGSH
jgi:hypothetical protein